MVSLLISWIGLRCNLIFTFCLLAQGFNEVVGENSYLTKECLDFTCNPPEESQDCNEVSDLIKPRNYELGPEDRCCPIYECKNNDGLVYFGAFGGYKKLSQRIRRGARKVKSKPVPNKPTEPPKVKEVNVCEGVTCKPKPDIGVCSSRNATSMSSTSVYGPTRICCPLFACTHKNGTITMHYTGPTDQKIHTKGRSMKHSPDLNAISKETCSGIYCMEGLPSKNCRKNTPSDIKILMKVQEDCCPMWTCTKPRSDSMYYIHNGMQQKSKFWKVEDVSSDDSLSSAPVTESPPNIDGNGTSTSTVAPEPNDLEVDVERGVKFTSLKRLPSSKCPRVECLPPQDGLKCSVLANPDKEKLKLLGLDSECCNIYKCSGKNKAFVVQFGMYAAQPESNITSTENPNDSSFRPPTTTLAPATTTTKSTPATKIKTTAAPAKESKTTTAPVEDIGTTLAPTAGIKTTASAAKTTKTTTTIPPKKAIARRATKTKTTAAPAEDSKTTTAPVEDTGTTLASTAVITTTASATKKTKATATIPPKKAMEGRAAKTKTTTAPAEDSKTTTPAVEDTGTTLAPTAEVKTTASTAKKIKTTTTLSPKKAIAGRAAKKPDTVPATGLQSITPISPTAADVVTETANEEVVDGEEIDDPSLMITNSTVNKPQCKNMQCFPAPSKESCIVAPLTDCDLVTLLGSALDCCESYKCKSDKGEVIQFGMTDGVSESVVSSPVSKDEIPASECSLPENEPHVTTTKPAKENRFEIEAVHSELPVTIRPVMIFDMVNKESPSTIKEVRYVKSCSGVSCSPPSGLDIKYCQKLQKGTVPKQMKPFGITTACCFVWKCVQTDNRVSTHYGVSQKPVVHIPFEYQGSNTEKLPKVLKVKDPEPASATSKCPNVICSPPLPNAKCKVADPSAIKSVKGSLRKQKKCCPIWICTRKDGTSVTLYGRTSPNAYKKAKFRSILQGKTNVPPATEDTTKIFGFENENNFSKRPMSKSKPQLKSSMKILRPPTTMSPKSEESQGEETLTTPTPPKKAVNGAKPSVAKPKKAKKQPTQQQQQQQQQQQRMNEIYEKYYDNVESNPDTDIQEGGDENIESEVPANSNQNVMFQKMEMNGIVMESHMPANGPPMPSQSMQMPGMTMNQYG